MPASQPNANMRWLCVRLFQGAFSDVKKYPRTHTHTHPFKSTCSRMQEPTMLVYVTYGFLRALFPLHKALYPPGGITAWVINTVYSQLHL